MYVTKMNELTKQQIRKYKINRSRLIPISKESMYVGEVIAIPTIMQSTLQNPKTKTKLLKAQKLLKAFSAEKIKLQYKILENGSVRTDIYFSEHKSVVEIDKKGHTDIY